VFNGIALGTIAAIAVYHVMALVTKARGGAQTVTPIEPENEPARP